MALTKKTETKETKNYTLEVTGVRPYNDSYFFNLVIDGLVTIYGCVFHQSKKGDWFTSFPSRKGKDNKYYNVAYMQLTDEDNMFIELEIEKAIK